MPEGIALQPYDVPLLTADLEADIGLPAHLVTLSDDSWTIWRAVCLRGAGFPVHHVLQLAAPACAHKADALLTAVDTYQSSQRQLLDQVAITNAKIRQMLSNVADDSDEYARLDGLLRALRKAERRLQKGKMPQVVDTPDIDSRLWSQLKTADEQVKLCQEQFQQAWAEARLQTSQAIRSLAGEDRFREAVMWQNRKAIHTGIDSLLKTPLHKNSSKERQREELVANYVQRYAAKNDTIGFFGPVVWIEIADQTEAMTLEPGDDLVTARTVYFEDWGIVALAKFLAQNEALRPWMRPRRMPQIRVKGSKLHLQVGDPVKLTMKQAAILQACDGVRTARDVAAKVRRNPLAGVKSEAEVFTILAELEAAKRLTWTFEIPTEGVYPEQVLRQLLEGIEDEALRQQALAPWQQLEERRAAVALAAGNSQQLDEAMGALEQSFTQITGASSTRRGGRTYAARTLVYEDCRRDVSIKLGSDLVQAIEAPLALMLTSARWFTFELAKRYQQLLKHIFEDVYAQYPEAGPGRVVGLPAFWLWTQPLFLESMVWEGEHPAEAVRDLFQAKWAEVLAVDTTVPQIAYDSDQLWPAVQRAFKAPRPGWQNACYQNPDVMIAAESAEAIGRGEYEFVLGELHMGINSMMAACFFYRHPTPGLFFEAAQFDRPAPCILPLVPRGETEQTTRTQFIFMSPEDVRLVLTQEACPMPGTRWLPISEWVVEDTGEEIVVRTRNGRYQFGLVETFAQFLAKETVDSFQIIPRQRHTPRLTIDRLVIRREAWRFTAEEVSFAYETDEAKRFLAARRWRQLHGLPRFLFAKVPVEKKPFYVDFDSPIYLRMLARSVRQTAEGGHEGLAIGLTEMLPSHEQTWLSDAKGQRYTSELRIAAVDVVGR